MDAWDLPQIQFKVHEKLMDFLELLTSLHLKAARWNSIGIQLGLSPDELATIEADSNDVQECLRKVLQKWYDRTPHPTWGQVITALRAPLLEEMKLAKELEHKMRISANPEPQEEKELELPAKILKENKATIKGSFAALVHKVTEKLERRDLSIKGFRLYMVNLFPPGDIIADSLTVTDIFEAISRHRLWDYSYCTPLEKIVDEFGGDDLELRGWIKDYKAKLAGFKATTKIVDYIKMCSDEEEIADAEQSLREDMARYDRQYCRKLAMKLKSRVTEKCLDYIDQFWQSIADHFFLPSLPVLLDSIQEGCVEVTWLVPTLSAIQIQANILDSAAFLEESEVMRVILDDEILYDEEGLDIKLLKACERGDVDEALALLTYGVVVDTTCTKERVTPLLVAARVGNSDVVELLLNYNASINQADCDGYTPLIVASLNNHLGVVQVLLAHNAEANIMAMGGWTALSSACFKGHLEIARELMQHGARASLKEIGAHEKRNWTPLMHIIDLKDEHLSMVELLLDAGALINHQTLNSWCPLSLACDNGHINIARLLIDRGADVNIWGEDDRNFGWTPLMVASNKGQYEICQLLLDSGAVVDLPHEGDGATPLIMACRLGRMDLVNLLLEHGADVHARCKNGITAVHVACQEGHLDIVKVLESHGAALDAVSENGCSCLMSACIGPDAVDAIQYLLEQKPALLNMQSQSGWSPLMFACDTGHSAVVAKLLSHCADVELCTHLSGLSSLMLATNQGHVEIVKLLLEAKASVDTRDKSAGWTALFVASKKGYLVIARVLLEHGADLSLKATDANVTAYDVASIHGQREVCEELEARGYQSLAPPTEDMRLEVERLGMVLTQNFLDIENIRTFHEVLQDEGRTGDQPRFSQQHQTFGIGHVDK